MVIYAYDFNINKAEEIAAIRAYAKKHQYITVSPGTYHKWCDKNISCDALEWLEIFKNAECVVTDTFHGTIASLITNTPMAVLVRDTLNANKMTDLLERTQITERRVSAITEEELDRILDNNIDFKVINSNLKMLRNKGIEYLESAIALCKEGTNE